MKHSSFPQTALGLQISLSLPLTSPFLPPPSSPAAFVQPDNPLLNPREHIFGTGTIKKKETNWFAFLIWEIHLQNLVQFQWRRGRRDDPVNLTYLYWGWGEGEWEDGLSSLQEIMALFVVSTHVSLRVSWLVWGCPPSAMSTQSQVIQVHAAPLTWLELSRGNSPVPDGVDTHPASPATPSLVLPWWTCWAQWISQLLPCVWRLGRQK